MWSKYVILSNMTTLNFIKNFIKEKDLMLIPRSKYENLLKSSKMFEQYEHLWKKAAKDKFLKNYSKSDAIYDQI